MMKDEGGDSSDNFGSMHEVQKMPYVNVSMFSSAPFIQSGSQVRHSAACQACLSGAEATNDGTKCLWLDVLRTKTSIFLEMPNEKSRKKLIFQQPISEFSLASGASGPAAFFPCWLHHRLHESC